jgi:hypothetical protein
VTSPVDAVPALPVVKQPFMVRRGRPPKAAKPTLDIVDIDRPVTAEELQAANEELKLGEETVQKLQELREEILQGRFKATEPRKIELGFLPESKVRITTPAKGKKVKGKYSKEQFEKYLETARHLAEKNSGKKGK